MEVKIDQLDLFSSAITVSNISQVLRHNQHKQRDISLCGVINEEWL